MRRIKPSHTLQIRIPVDLIEKMQDLGPKYGCKDSSKLVRLCIQTFIELDRVRPDMEDPRKRQKIMEKMDENLRAEAMHDFFTNLPDNVRTGYRQMIDLVDDEKEKKRNRLNIDR